RHHEDDHHDEDLQRHADGGVAGEADVVADHGVVHHALQSAKHVLQYGGPRELPHRAGDGTLDDRTVERFGNGGHARYSTRSSRITITSTAFGGTRPDPFTPYPSRGGTTNCRTPPSRMSRTAAS